MRENQEFGFVFFFVLFTQNSNFFFQSFKKYMSIGTGRDKLYVKFGRILFIRFWVTGACFFVNFFFFVFCFCEAFFSTVLGRVTLKKDLRRSGKNESMGNTVVVEGVFERSFFFAFLLSYSSFPLFSKKKLKSSEMPFANKIWTQKKPGKNGWKEQRMINHCVKVPVEFKRNEWRGRRKQLRNYNFEILNVWFLEKLLSVEFLNCCPRCVLAMFNYSSTFKIPRLLHWCTRAPFLSHFWLFFWFLQLLSVIRTSRRNQTRSERKIRLLCKS